MHGHIFPYEVSVKIDGEKQKVEVGGISRFATMVAQEELANPGNLFVTNMGDINEGPLFYFFHGGAETTGLNQAGVEIATLGNHEFDLGEEILLEAMSKANYPFVVSNLTPKEGELPERDARHLYHDRRKRGEGRFLRSPSGRASCGYRGSRTFQC